MLSLGSSEAIPAALAEIVGLQAQDSTVQLLIGTFATHLPPACPDLADNSLAL